MLEQNLNNNENLITLFFGEEHLYFIKVSKEKYSIEKSALTKQSISELLRKIAPIYASDYLNSNLYFNQDLFSFNTKAAHEFYSKVLHPIINDIPVESNLVFSLPPTMSPNHLSFSRRNSKKMIVLFTTITKNI